MIIINGKIYTCKNKKIIENGYIITKGTIIFEIGKMCDFKDEYKNDCDDGEIIDATGKIITPGFIDGHCHLGICGDSMGFEGDDANEETDPTTPQVRAIDAINPQDRAFCDAAQSGVTCVASSPGSANPIAGQICCMKTVGVRVDDMVVEPFVAMKFAFGENPKSTYGVRNQAPNTRMATAALIREELAKAKRYQEDIKKAEADEDETLPDFDPKLEALLPLLNRKVRAHIHAHRADDIFTGIRVAKEFGFEYALIHCTDGSLIAKELKEENAMVMIGPVIGGRTKPELQNHSVGTAGELYKKGINVAITTDHPEVPVNMLALSAAICLHNGLPYEEALNAITINPAKMLNVSKKVGSLEKGKDADILIFNGDPLSGFNKPQIVIINGEFAR